MTHVDGHFRPPEGLEGESGVLDVVLGGAGFLFLLLKAVELSLVDVDNLIAHFFELLDFTHQCQCVLDGGFWTTVEQEGFCLIVELQGYNDLLEFYDVSRGQFGLFKAKEFFSSSILHVYKATLFSRRY